MTPRAARLVPNEPRWFLPFPSQLRGSPMYAAPEEWPRVNSEGVSDGLNELVVFFLLMNFVLHCSPIIHSHLSLCHHSSSFICHYFNLHLSSYRMKLKVPYHHLTSLLQSSLNSLPSPKQKKRKLNFWMSGDDSSLDCREGVSYQQRKSCSRAGQDRNPATP